MERGVINSQEDLNTTISGIYRVNDGLSSPITNGQFICYGIGTDLAIQKFVDWSGGNVYIRNYWYGTWHSWKKITIGG